MTLPASSRPGAPGLEWPLTILAVAFALFVTGELLSSSAQQELLRWQTNNVESLLPKLDASQKQLADLSAKRDELVKQSLGVQNTYQSLLNDVLDLAKDDKEAAEVIKTFGIQRSGPATESKK